MSEERVKLQREHYVVRICPECGSQQQGSGPSHFMGSGNDCPNFCKVFAVEEVEVVPRSRLEKAEEALKEISAILGTPGNCPNNGCLGCSYEMEASAALANKALDEIRAKG